MPDRCCNVGLVGEPMTLACPGCLAQRGRQLPVVGEDDPQRHLRELGHEAGLEEQEVRTEGAEERSCPLSLEQVGDDDARKWSGAHPVVGPCAWYSAAAVS